MRAALFLSVALVVAPAALAQTNSQHQTGDAEATTVIDIGHAQDASASAIASGNVVRVEAEGVDTLLINDQGMDGDTKAVTDANIDDADGNIAIASAAVANGATADLRGSTITIDSLSVAQGDVAALTAFTGGHAANAATSASAAGNVAALSTSYSDTELLIAQDSTGNTRAAVDAAHEHIDDQVVSGAVASANNLTVSGYTSTLLSRTRQDAHGGNVAASVNLQAQHAQDASANTGASANSITLDNQWGFFETRVIQNASAQVSADTQVALSDHFHGFGSAGAYGVGNQIAVSNVGSDTWMTTAQDNAGDVSASASFAGEGGDTLASAAAYGNSVSGVVCSQCDRNVPSLRANNNQTNSGDVTASSRLNAPNANSAASSATAIGNAATYAVRGP